MGALNEFLQTKGIYTLVMILFFLGVYGMVLSKNYMKKLMAMNVMQDRKSTRLNSTHYQQSRMPSSA